MVLPRRYSNYAPTRDELEKLLFLPLCAWFVGNQLRAKWQKGEVGVFLLVGILWYSHDLLVSVPKPWANRIKSYFFHFALLSMEPIEGKVAKIRRWSFLLAGVLWYFHDLRVSMRQPGTNWSSSYFYHFALVLLETN